MKVKTGRVAGTACGFPGDIEWVSNPVSFPVGVREAACVLSWGAGAPIAETRMMAIVHKTHRRTQDWVLEVSTVFSFGRCVLS